MMGLETWSGLGLATATLDLRQVPLFAIERLLALRLVATVLGGLRALLRGARPLQLVTLFRCLVVKARCLHVVLGRTLFVAGGVLFLAESLAIARVATDSAQLAGRGLPFFRSP
ncbi:MAG TPA: hypothetical protein VG898_02485 [Solirubrobacterales bacterium]|nr:hypothetical protein [Solirubrobacterales bacterium]